MAYKRKKAVFLLLILALVPLLAPPAAIAHSPALPAQDQPETRTVLIQEKATGPRFIYVDERAFRVLPEATIRDGKGDLLTLEDLPIPCKARITYGLPGFNRRPYVLEIIYMD